MTKKIVFALLFPGFIVGACLAFSPYNSLTNKHEENNISTVCTLSMFGGDENALRSCMTAYALQHNWFPSPISGLFSYQTWNGFDGFWQNGAVLETLANFMYYGNNTMYKSVITGSLRDVYSLLESYYPQPSFDDMGWYGLSYARIHEVLGPGNDDPSYGFLYEAKQIYDWIWDNGWDKNISCDGGFWFDQTQKSKQTVENAQMLQLGSKLYRLTKDASIVPRIEKTWKFLESNVIVSNETYLVADGLRNNCSSDQNFGPTYNMGLMIGGLVEAAPVLNKTVQLIPLAHKIATATIHLATKNGVLVEYCAPNCDDDAKMFKGIFLRNLRYLIDYTKKYKDPIGLDNLPLYQQFIQHNCDTAWEKNRCEPTESNCIVIYKDGKSLHNTTVGPVFGIHFAGPFNYSAPMQQTCALDLFVSAILENTKCVGSTCGFDPPIPQPSPLTCADNPCPVDQPCCEYQQEYYTCCESTQKCQSGECL
ncbi:uncharacterized protein LOC143452323 [Clavelina lepadiformis]|uniref:uncharacterized protein LOC143452323 n=1 Tax=Clavelina lepadiformis TaxID=159417 RepID=UPI0040426308